MMMLPDMGGHHETMEMRQHSGHLVFFSMAKWRKPTAELTELCALGLLFETQQDSVRHLCNFADTPEKSIVGPALNIRVLYWIKGFHLVGQGSELLQGGGTGTSLTLTKYAIGETYRLRHYLCSRTRHARFCCSVSYAMLPIACVLKRGYSCDDRMVEQTG